MEKQNPSQNLTTFFGVVGQVSVFFEEHSYKQIKSASDKASECIRRDVVKRDTPSVTKRYTGGVTNRYTPSVAKHDTGVDDVTKRYTIIEAVRTLETLVDEFIPIFKMYYNH